MPLTSAAATDVLIFAFRRRHQDVDARRRHGNVFAAVGAVEQFVVCVGRRHRDHVGIGAGIKRRRFRSGIAGGGTAGTTRTLSFPPRRY